jgi:iron complex outermembrane receptor protein
MGHLRFRLGFKVSILAILALSVCLGVRAQQTNQNPKLPTQKTVVVVTGSWEPVPLEESDRSVNVYSLRDSVVLFNSLADVLDLDSSVEVQSRDLGGIQDDISIRGGTFEQTLFLLDGIRLNDTQSAHYDFDIPVPMDAIGRIEVLRGSGSTLYGSDAVAGAIDVITRQPSDEPVELVVRGGYGSFGTNEQSGFLSFHQGFLSQQFSFQRELSDGFTDGRDYRNFVAGSQTWMKTKLGLTRVYLGYVDRPFGANQFYGNFDSWERTKTWLATLSQDLGKRTLFQFAYRRHSDLYVLLRDNPSFYTNRHIDDNWEFALRRQDPATHLARIYYGAEGLGDHVASNNLGVHSRTQAAVYAALDVRALRRFSFNAGAREEFYSGFGTGLQQIFVPNASAGYWLSSKLKLRAAASRAFRLPNYTDLYYSDPANVGNPNLKPERAVDYEGGLDWNPHPHWRGAFTVFQRRDRNDIDYVRANPNAIWQAMNFDRLVFTGWEASIAVSLPYAQTVRVEYTGLHGAEAALDGYQSKYAFNYPTQEAAVSWERVSPRGWIARVRLGAVNQYQRNAYALIDADAAWTRSRIRPYIRFTNLTNTFYEPVYGVPMPGRAVMGGVEVCVICRSK